MIHKRLLLLVVATSPLLSALALEEQPSCAVADAEGECTDDDCFLYLAPSSIPGAGLGVYTAQDVPEGSTVGPSDLFVALQDDFKTLPYKGQQRFLSWLGYIWPSDVDALYHSYDELSFPGVPESHYSNSGVSAATSLKFFEEGDPVNAWAPGLVSLMNSLPDLQNVELQRMKRKLPAGQVHYNVALTATRDIEAGSELFLNYGDEWHERYETEDQYRTLERKYRLQDSQDLEFETLADYRERLDGVSLPTEEQKRLSEILQYEVTPEDVRELEEKVKSTTDANERKKLEAKQAWQQEKSKRWEILKEKLNSVKFTYYNIDDISDGVETKRITSDDSNDDDKNNEEEDNGEDDDEEEDDDSIKSLEWLQQHGACVDRIRPGESTIDDAGMGAFAHQYISSGSVISPAPLLALKRDDVVIYEADVETENFRDVLHSDVVEGQELLLNFCFGHAESELLLLPNAPVVNFINHANEPNAEIRWPSHSLLGDPKEWLELHPVDVMERSGKLMMEFVALRDIKPGEEITINYGQEWKDAWVDFEDEMDSSDDDDDVFSEFRHEIGVPDGFFPNNWLHQSAEHEIVDIDKHLEPGEWQELTWAHSGKPINKGTYRVGLPSGFSNRIREFAEEKGIIDLYRKLLYQDILASDEWFQFNASSNEDEEWFAQRYKSTTWDFNIHYIAAWNKAADQSLMRALGAAGYDVVLESMAKKFNFDNVTCIHTSFMGVTECDRSLMHADVYGTGDKGFNLIFPLMVVNGSKPELDIQSDDANIVTSVNYQYDVALAMGDWGYHKTSPISYDESGEMRVVLGMYCGQVDDSNAKMMAYIYNGEDPAPFMGKFDHPNRAQAMHWSNDGVRLPK